MMSVGELIEMLKKYNQDAEVDVVVNGYPKEFEICYGGSEGCQPQTCDCVNLMVDTPREQEGGNEND